MRGLLTKELRMLVPFLGLYLFLTAVSVWVAPSDPVFPDLPQPDLHKFFTEFLTNLVGNQCFFGLLIGAGLLVNEEENGTLGFLDGLPVRRTTVFAAKWIAGFLVLTAMLVMDWGLGVGSLGLSWESTRPPFPWGDLLKVWLLAQGISFLCLGVALWLSLLRRWLLIGVGILGLFLVWLELDQFRWMAWLSPFSLMSLSVVQNGVQIPAEPLLSQIGIGAVAALVALGGFHRMGTTTTNTWAAWVNRSHPRAQLLRLASWVLGIAIFGSMIWGVGKLAERDGSSGEMENPLASEKAFRSLSNQNYRFLFWDSDRTSTVDLLQHADAAYGDVAALLGAPPRRDLILVDLGSRTRPEVLGHAHWKKIHVDRASLGTPMARTVLIHETAHVLLEELSQGRASEQFRFTRFFHEGLATYVENKFASSPRPREESDVAAAAAHRWRPMEFEALADDHKLIAERDAKLVYPMGAVWCEALVECYGEGGLGEVARAMSKVHAAPKDARTFWSEVLGRAGQDLERVNAAFAKRLGIIASSNAPVLTSLPRLRARASLRGDVVWVQVSFEGNSPGRLSLEARVNPDQGLIGVDSVLLSDGEGFRLDRARYAGEAVWVAPGWMVTLPDGASFEVFEPWGQIPVER
ncbi:MAG: ABC transporter permease [Verrucomicrobiales bacterium]|nr:ABC transporter permease [Verrucomicrobiales bacterium]